MLGSALPDAPVGDAFTQPIPLPPGAVTLRVEVDEERLYFAFRLGQGQRSAGRLGLGQPGTGATVPARIGVPGRQRLGDEHLNEVAVLTVHQHQGAGLGLPFAKAIIELHGGSLELASEVGQGTTVSIELPIHANAISQAA